MANRWLCYGCAIRLPSLLRTILPSLNLGGVSGCCCGQFGVDPLVIDRGVAHSKERDDGGASLAPFSRAHLGLALQAGVVVCQRPTIRPVGANEVEVRPALDRRQVARVCPKVSPVHRHPGIGTRHQFTYLNSVASLHARNINTDPFGVPANPKHHRRVVAVEELADGRVTGLRLCIGKPPSLLARVDEISEAARGEYIRRGNAVAGANVGQNIVKWTADFIAKKIIMFTHAALRAVILR